jgi:hypothetical protein
MLYKVSSWGREKQLKRLIILSIGNIKETKKQLISDLVASFPSPTKFITQTDLVLHLRKQCGFSFHFMFYKFKFEYSMLACSVHP